MRFRHAGDLDVPQPRPCLRYAVFDLPGQSGSCSFLHATTVTYVTYARTLPAGVRVSADLDPSRFWIPYDVTHCLGMRSSLKCTKVTYKMCVAHPRNPLFGEVLADLDGQNLRFRERLAGVTKQIIPHSLTAQSSAS